MELRKQRIWIVAGAMLAMAVGLLGYFVTGPSAIESRLRAQLLRLAGTYLEPELRFERLTFVRPRTILLDRVTLSSPDPTNPGRSWVILAVKRARLDLTEIPRPGEPIKFSQVILESPEIHAIAATPGGAGLVGYSHLLKRSPGSQMAALDADSAPMKVSDFLLIRHVELNGGIVHFNSRKPDMAPIWLDGINARLDFAPADITSSPGLYTIATTVSRKPAFELDLQGKVDFDTFKAELAKLEVTLDLQEKNAHFLPSEWQKFLKTFEITGLLHLFAAGQMPLANPHQWAIQSKGDLTAARVAVGENCLSIGEWNWEVNLDAGIITISKADAQLLGGDMHLTGTIPLDGTLPANLELSADHVQIQQMLRSIHPNTQPRYAGNVAGKITFSAPLARWNKQAGGGGTLTLRQGRVDHLPLLGTIVSRLGTPQAPSPDNEEHDLTDTADCNFKFDGAGVRIESFDANSGSRALRATGAIGFDRQIDLRLNAGTLERIQDSLGAVGRVWASVSDAMAAYRVTGTWSDPKVSLELGGGP